MTKVRLFVVLTSIFALFLCETAAFAVQTASGKDLIGKWQGTGKDAGGQEQSVTVNIKLDGKKMIAEIFSDAGNWTSDNVTFADAKCTIIWTTPEGESAKVVGSVTKDIMKGEWWLGDSNGTFELKRVVN